MGRFSPFGKGTRSVRTDAWARNHRAGSIYFGTQPYGPEASAFAKRWLDGERVGLELDVQKIDPYGRLLAYVYLPDGRMFNETLVRQGYAQVATFPPNVKYQERFLEAQREARAANRGLWDLSAGELCKQTGRGNGIGGGCSGSESQSVDGSASAGRRHEVRRAKRDV
jgi:micrococcal nuclease